jgi:hypothetical protein
MNNMEEKEVFDHLHEKFELGMVEIIPSYEVVVYNNGGKYAGCYEFFDIDEALELKKELIESKKYDNVVFLECSRTSIVKSIN